MAAYVRWVTAHAMLVAALMLVATCGLLSRLATLKIEVNPDSQLPLGHPYIQALARLHEVFGEKNLVFIGLFPNDGDIYTPEFLAKLAHVTERIGALPGLVQRTYWSLALPKAVDIRATAEGMAVHPFLDPLPKTRAEALALRARLDANPQYLGTIVAPDGSAAAIVADFEFRPPLIGYPEVQQAVTQVLEEENDGTFHAHLSGPAIYVAWLARYSARMFFFFPLAFVVIGLVRRAGDPLRLEGAMGRSRAPRRGSRPAPRRRAFRRWYARTSCSRWPRRAGATRRWSGRR